MKRWGLRATTLSAVAKADAGQNSSSNHLNPNVLYMMLCARAFCSQSARAIGQPYSLTSRKLSGWFVLRLV